ncbi:MAG: hypothetical protein ACRCZY_05145 [Phocaeicola sp.]
MKTKEQLSEMSKEDLIEYIVEQEKFHANYSKAMIEREKRLKTILNSVGIIMETYTK